VSGLRSVAKATGGGRSWRMDHESRCASGSGGAHHRRTSIGASALPRTHELKLRAERKGGEMLGETVEHGGDRRSDSSGQRVNLKDIGMEQHQSSRWQRIASLPDIHKLDTHQP
jgi:hypothetical protein